MVNSKIKNIIKKLILEAYVDSQGKLGNFDFPRPIGRDTDMYANTELPSGNRVKMNGEPYVRIIIPNKNEIIYQNKSTRKNVNIIEFFKSIFEDAKRGTLGYKLTMLYQNDTGSGIEYRIKEDEASLILKGVNEKFDELYGNIENYLNSIKAEYEKESDLVSDYEEVEDYKTELKNRYDRLEKEYIELQRKHREIYNMFK